MLCRTLRAILCTLTILLAPSTPVLAGATEFAVLEDPAGAFTLEQARASSDWETIDGTRSSTWLPGGAVWMTWTPPTMPDRAEAIRLTDSTGSRLQAWLIDERGRMHVARPASGGPMDAGEAIRSSVISLPEQAGRRITVLARQTSALGVHFAPTFTVSMRTGDDSWTSLLPRPPAPWLALLGLAVLMTLGLLMAAATHDLGQLAVALLVGAMGLWILQTSGLITAWFWPDKPQWMPHGSALGLALLATLTAWTARTVLDDALRDHPWATRLLGILAIVGLVVATTVSLVPTAVSVATACAGLAVAAAIAIWRTSARLISGDRTSVWPLSASLVLITIGVRTPLQLSGIELPAPLQGALAEQAGLFVAALLVTVAAVARLYTPERMRQAARAHMLNGQAQATQALEQTVAARTFELQIANEKLAQMTRVDGLTGVFNRRHFDEALRAAIAASRDARRTMAVIMIDLDHFKRLNDDYGHACGDECLILAGRVATAAMPENLGMVARYGGEEFVALMPDCDAAAALEFAETVRHAIETAMPQFNGASIRMTASLGVCCRRPDTPGDGAAMLAAADAALYVAKRGGRNQVVDNSDGRFNDAESKDLVNAGANAKAPESRDRPNQADDAQPADSKLDEAQADKAASSPAAQAGRPTAMS